MNIDECFETVSSSLYQLLRTGDGMNIEVGFVEVEMLQILSSFIAKADDCKAQMLLMIYLVHPKAEVLVSLLIQCRRDAVFQGFEEPGHPVMPNGVSLNNL